MADVENQQESPLPVKRKPDPYCQDQDNVANKAQKLQPSNSVASESKDRKNHGDMDSSKENAKMATEALNSPEKGADTVAERDEIDGGGGDVRGDEEVDEEETNGEEEEEEEVVARRVAEVDRKGKGIMRDDKGKGKGIMRDDKGKGKLIEEDDSDEEDDDDDDDVDSDLSDDPLAEVDLDNILPSRTRRRAMQPGLYISDEIANHDEDDDDEDDDDDSEDSDA